MSTQTPAGPAEAAADLIRRAIAEDGRDKKDIAADAGMSAPHLTRLCKPYSDGGRNLTSRQARKLGRTWPHYRDELTQLAIEVEDVATLPTAGPEGSADPGLLRRLAVLLFPEHPHPSPTRPAHAPAPVGA